MKPVRIAASLLLATAVMAGCNERNGQTGVTGPAIGPFSAALATLSTGPTFTTIDFPGGFVTLAADINKSGQIVGRYTDIAGLIHGFLLSKGAFSSVTFPGAVWTRAIGISRGGSIVGDYSLTDLTGDKAHGFLLQDGRYLSLDFPGAAFTVAEGIDGNGDIVGYYTNDGSNTNNRHGFLLRNGAFTAIDFPGAGSTEAWRINDNGEVLGRYRSTTDSKWHLYQLNSGSFTPIADFPGADQTAPDSYGHLGGFNSLGDITSDYCTSTCQKLSPAVHGFLLSAGVYTSIDPPGAKWSLALGIDDAGDIVGTYLDASGQIHGYLRTP